MFLVFFVLKYTCVFCKVKNTILFLCIFLYVYACICEKKVVSLHAN